MKVVVAGSGSPGGREQAIAWACRRHGHEVTIVPALTERPDADLVIIGPEAAAADGVADRCAGWGVPCFGPTAELARLETSKGYTRSLAADLGIPSPQFSRHSELDAALAWWHAFGAPVVVKQDGLAAGKGVIVPTGLQETEDAIAELLTRGPVVLEERLSGPECSLMAVCDGTTARPLPLAQDHKRIGEGDTGPNTGGMGAYAPAPVAYDADELTKIFVQPVIDHLAARGTPYVGVLYAGLMLSPDGPRLLEFNCRFGDPEAQAVLPLLDTDLAELALACVQGRLASLELRLREGAACTVVAAAAGYPASPQTGGAITIGDLPERAILFPAGMSGSDEPRVTGGRVLAVTGLGRDIAEARTTAYMGIGTIAFDGMQVRRDIGWRAQGAITASYAAAGVDIDEGGRAVAEMAEAVQRTHGPSVLRGIGSFGGAFSAAGIAAMRDPVLVASTDGVGTKVELAARLGQYHGVGIDIVNHCINDVLVQGARPLFFLDYVASSELKAGNVAAVVQGMAEACEAAGCALLGGETAEMPGVYAPGAFDIAGTLVGVVERDDLLPQPGVRPGDVLIGLASNGPHTNGYSLLRRLFAWLPLDVTPSPLTRPLGAALLEPHRSYLDVLTPALATRKVKALAHITGGGLPENLPRVLPDGTSADVRLDSWPVPGLFRLVREIATAMPTDELYRSLNMGIGMVVVADPADVDELVTTIDEPVWVIGEVTAAPSGVAPHVRLA